MVRAYIAFGLFDHPLPATASTSSSTPAHKAIAQREVEQGSVLLKNAGILPLSSSSKKVAVIGQTASNDPTPVDVPNAQGGTTTVGISAGTVCAEGTLISFFGGRPATNPCPDPTAPLDAIKARAAEAGASGD